MTATQIRVYLALYKNGKPIKDQSGNLVAAAEGDKRKNWVFTVARDEDGSVVVLETRMQFIGAGLKQ